MQRPWHNRKWVALEFNIMSNFWNGNGKRVLQTNLADTGKTKPYQHPARIPELLTETRAYRSPSTQLIFRVYDKTGVSYNRFTTNKWVSAWPVLCDLSHWVGRQCQFSRTLVVGCCVSLSELAILYAWVSVTVGVMWVLYSITIFPCLIWDVQLLYGTWNAGSEGQILYSSHSTIHRLVAGVRNMRHSVSVTLHLTSCNKASTLYIPHRCLLPFWPPKITRISYHTVISTNFAGRRKQEYLTGFLPNSSNCRKLDAAAIQMKLDKKNCDRHFYGIFYHNTDFEELTPATLNECQR